MKLHKVFQNDESRIYGIVVNGKPFFFYEGFTSTEEAKTALRNFYLSGYSSDTSKCIKEAMINIMLKGTWSTID